MERKYAYWIGSYRMDEFKKNFLGKYFPRDKRENKVHEFINLRQCGMSVKELP